MTKVDWIIRAITAAAVALLGVAAAIVSFRHAFAVVVAHGEDGLTAVITPLTVDGMVLVAALVILDAARRGLPAPALAVVTLAAGIAATLGINALYGISHGLLGAVVAAWPALALVLSTELLMGLIRRGHRGRADVAALRSEPALKSASPGAGLNAGELRGDEHHAGSVVSDALVKNLRDDERHAGAVTRPVSGETRRAGVPDREVRVPVPDPHQVRAVAEFAEELARGEVPSLRQIKLRMRMGQPRASQVRDYLAHLVSSNHAGGAPVPD
ncbi:DUF2637 domain-containing protein [Actinocorallia longicatena]|uniref:DUF2637 domain-containing protein n=1 Tax=Actinocorallia longicatena TaxID=111803 RepID=A0ABP6QAI0_9ACTN